MRYPQFSKDRYNMQDLIDLVALLRSENGCPWDREQTHATIRKNLIEETYEVLNALDRQDTANLREELGDLLLQVVFHTQMEREAGRFDLEDVITELCQKLVVRHPHVFGDTGAQDSKEALANWDRMKKETKQQETYTETLQAVPENLPALMRAQKLAHRAQRGGFNLTGNAQARLTEDAQSLTDALQSADTDRAFDRLGDLLFDVCCASKGAKLDAEEALTRASQRFIRDFSAAEQAAMEQYGKSTDALSPDQLSALWADVRQRG